MSPSPLNVTRHIEEAIRAVVVDFDLVGLNSMDFLCDGDNLYVLERLPDLILVPPPSVWSSCRRPLTAAAVRTDPCGTAFLGRVGIETGLYGRDCPPGPRPACPYALPVEIDLMSAERRAMFEPVYERVSELPVIGRLNVYRRRGWTLPSAGPPPPGATRSETGLQAERAAGDE